MESIVGLAGLGGVLVLHEILSVRR
jgi:hypothetical protein